MTEGPETQNPKLLQPPILHGGLADSLLVKNCWDPQSSRRVQFLQCLGRYICRGCNYKVTRDIILKIVVYHYKSISKFFVWMSGPEGKLRLIANLRKHLELKCVMVRAPRSGQCHNS